MSKILRVAQCESQKGEISVVRMAYHRGPSTDYSGYMDQVLFGAPVVLEAILEHVAKEGAPDVLVLRDQYLVDALTRCAPIWEAQGWENKRGRQVKNAAALRTLWLQLKAVGTEVRKAEDNCVHVTALFAVAARDVRSGSVGPHDPHFVASDGSFRDGQAHWAWVDAEGGSAVGVTPGVGSSSAELAAAAQALSNVSDDVPVVLTTDSETVITALRKRMHKLAERGWPEGVPDVHHIRNLYEARRGLSVAVRWEKGHQDPTSLLARADALASNR